VSFFYSRVVDFS